MTKIKYAKHPRVIARRRLEHPSSIFFTVPVKIVKQWQLKAGEILEFVFVTQGTDSYVKVRKVEN